MSTKMKHLTCICLLVCMLALCLGFWGCGGSSTATGGSSGGTSGGSGTGTVSGTAFNSDTDEPVSGVIISSGGLTTVTNADGEFSLAGFRSGSHTITAAKSDYYNESALALVNAGQVTTVDFEMSSKMANWLAFDTTYNWKVEAVQADGSVVAGPQWSFTTGDDPEEGLIAPVTMVQGIDEESAGAVARAFLSRKGESGFTISSSESIVDGGTTIAYAFNLNPAGFVIVSGSSADVLPPVVAYSFEGPFSSRDGSSNCLINMVRNGIRLRLAALKSGAGFPGKVVSRNRALWNGYLADASGERSAPSPKAVYGPLLSGEEWHQFPPYNDYCPTDSKTGERCVVGCPATAFAQVFNYWKWPSAVNEFKDSDSYYTKDKGMWIDAKTANMGKVEYNSGNPDNTTRARLSFALGVGFQMCYGSDMSYSDIGPFAKKLKYWDYYEASCNAYNRGATITTTPIIDDIKNNRPVVVLFREYNEQGKYESGHVVVADGYNDQDATFHINYGWKKKAGRYWFAFIDDVPSNWSQVSKYVYNIRPNKTGATQSVARALIPQNPWPGDGASDVPVDEIPYWDECNGAVYYNCYVWKAGTQEPKTPCFHNLSYPEASSNFTGIQN